MNVSNNFLSSVINQSNSIERSNKESASSRSYFVSSRGESGKT